MFDIFRDRQTEWVTRQGLEMLTHLKRECNLVTLIPYLLIRGNEGPGAQIFFILRVHHLWADFLLLWRMHLFIGSLTSVFRVLMNIICRVAPYSLHLQLDIPYFRSQSPANKHNTRAGVAEIMLEDVWGLFIRLTSFLESSSILGLSSFFDSS